jgi:asparagine synthase (glutamine-hydrolysing)
MPRLAGFIGRLPADTAARGVVAMASAMQRAPHQQLAQCSVPAMGVHLAWVADAEPSGGCLPVVQEDDIVLVGAGDWLLPDAGVGVSRHANRLAAWIGRLRTDAPGALLSLGGLHAGVFVDRTARRARLFTEAHGIERLYACDTADGLYFASEPKALLRVLRQARAFDREGVAQYLAFGCTLPPRTLFEGISVVPQASCWTWDGGTWDRRRTFDPRSWEAQETLPIAAFEEAYAQAFLEILPAYFAAGAPVGLALTGGLDTRMILAGRPADWCSPISYTYAGRQDTRDVVLARALAGDCGIPHVPIRIGDDFLDRFAAMADRTVVETDGAHGVTGSHESYLSERARELAPVRVTGVFGGEVLRGLSPWRRLRLSRGLVIPEIAEAAGVSATLATPDEHPVTSAAFGTTPAAMHGILASCRGWLTFRTPFLDRRLVQLAYRAPRPDASTEASAVRMLRQHMPRLAPLPTDRGRQVGPPRRLEAVTRAFEQVSFKIDYMANESLAWPFTLIDPLIDRLYAPAPVLGRHKFLRYRRWFRRELAGYVRDRVGAADRLPFWGRAAIARLADDHIRGATNLTEDLNVVLTLEAVDRLLLRDIPPSDVDHGPLRTALPDNRLQHR